MHTTGFIVVLLAGLAPTGPLEPLGRLSDPAIREASGIVQSRRHPDIFWVHNDSGNPPLLFAVRLDGSLVRKYKVQVPNIDWEDIAADDRGHLYLGEIGNNEHLLPLRAVYQFDEPDPARSEGTAIAVVTASYYRFPTGGRFDAEGLFVDHGRAIVVAKTVGGREAELFAIPFNPPAPLLRPATPRSLGRLTGFTEPATGASLSPDGHLLAVCSARETRVYRRAQGDRWSPGGVVRYRASDIEAVCWDGADLILAGESGGLYRIAESSWRGAGRTAPPRARTFRFPIPDSKFQIVNLRVPMSN